MAKLLDRLLKPGESLKWRTIQGFLVIIFGDAYLHALRLGGNLIMTRLLFPEAFGLMLIVNLVFTALHMLSDAGIAQAVISNGRNKGPSYLNTAWSLMCVRGVTLSAIGCALAWPISLYYNDPRLIGLIAITALTSIISGFTSPNQILYDRDVKKAHGVFLEAASQTLAMGATLLWLWIQPTLWALAAYGVVASLLKTGGSYFVFKGNLPSFNWDKKEISEIMHFGKWILLSTAMTFLATQGDKFIVSHWINATELGIFSIAISLGKFTDQVAGSITWRLLFPVYSELKEGTSDRLTKQAMRAELILFAACAPFILAFTLFGNQIIDLMYDARYHEAGWMLRVLTLGTIFSIFNETLIAMMLAHGHSHKTGLLQSFRVVLMIGVMTIGGSQWGLTGLVYSIAVAPALFYIVLLYMMRSYNVSPKVELGSIAFVLLIVLSYWKVFGWPGITP